MRRGLALSAGMVAANTTFRSAEAADYPALVWSTIRAALTLATGEGAVRVVASRVALLTEEELKTMLLSKLKLASMAVLTTTAIVVGTVGVFAQQRPGSSPEAAADPPAAGQPGARGPGDKAIGQRAPAYIGRSRNMMIAQA